MEIATVVIFFVVIPLVVGHLTNQRDWDDYGD